MPVLPAVELDEPVALSFRISAGAHILHHATEGRVPADSLRPVQIAFASLTTDWSLLDHLLAPLARGTAAVREVGLTSADGTAYALGDLVAELPAGEVQALVVAAAAPASRRERAFATLGWEVTAGNGLVRRSVPATVDPADYRVFGGAGAAVLAMVVAAFRHRPQAVEASPENPTAAPNIVLPRSWSAYGRPQGDGNHGLVTVMVAAALRQGVPLPDGVTSGEDLLAYAADRLAAGRLPVPALRGHEVNGLIVQASPPELQALLQAAYGDDPDRNLQDLDPDAFFEWAGPYVWTYYDRNPDAARAAEIGEYFAAEQAGRPWTREQAFALHLRDPALWNDTEPADALAILAHALDVRLLIVDPEGGTEPLGPNGARHLVIGDGPGGYREYGPPERLLTEDTLKTGPGVERHGHLTVIGTVNSGLLARLTTLRVTQPVLVAGALAADSRELTALGSLIRRYRAEGREPLVVAPEPSHPLLELLAHAAVHHVVRAPSGMDHVWTATGSDGRARAEGRDLGPEHLTSTGTPAPERTAPERLVEDWLDVPSWAEAGEYLAGHLPGLLAADAAAVLAERVETYPGDRELRAYEVVLGLARQAGGLGSPDQQGLAPIAPDGRNQEDGLDRQAPAGPLSPLAALHYLQPQTTQAQRRAWNDQLLSLLLQGKLTGAQAAGLARGLLRPDGGAAAMPDAALSNARIVEAVGLMLSLTPDEAAQPAGNKTYERALSLVADCVVTPTERWMNVLRLDRGRDRLQRLGLPRRFTAAQAQPYLDNLRVLTETFSNC